MTEEEVSGQVQQPWDSSTWKAGKYYRAYEGIGWDDTA